MRVTPGGIVRPVRLLHLSNALSSMVVTVGGIVTVVKPIAPEKAQTPMFSTSSGTT